MEQRGCPLERERGGGGARRRARGFVLFSSICLIFSICRPLFFASLPASGDGAPEVTARRPPKFCGWRLAQHPGGRIDVNLRRYSQDGGPVPRVTEVQPPPPRTKHFCCRPRRFPRLLLFLCSPPRWGQAGGSPNKIWPTNCNVGLNQIYSRGR